MGTSKKAFSLSTYFAAALGATAPAAIILTGLAAQNADPYLSTAGVSCSLLAAGSYAGCVYNVTKGYATEMAKNSAQSHDPVLPPHIEKDIKKSGWTSAVLEANMHGFMYALALYHTTGSSLYIAPATAMAVIFATSSRHMLQSVRRIKDHFTNAVSSAKNESPKPTPENEKRPIPQRGSFLIAMAALSSTISVGFSMAAFFSASWTQLAIAATLSTAAASIGAAYAARLYANMGNIHDKADGARRKTGVKDALHNKQARTAGLTIGKAELSIHASMLFSGAAIISGHPALWAAAAGSLVSCSYHAFKTFDIFTEKLSGLGKSKTHASSPTPQAAP